MYAASLLSSSCLCDCWVVINEHGIIPNLEGTPNIVDRWGNPLRSQLAAQKSFGVSPSASSQPNRAEAKGGAGHFPGTQ